MKTEPRRWERTREYIESVHKSHLEDKLRLQKAACKSSRYASALVSKLWKIKQNTFHSAPLLFISYYLFLYSILILLLFCSSLIPLSKEIFFILFILSFLPLPLTTLPNFFYFLFLFYFKSNFLIQVCLKKQVKAWKLFQINDGFV